VPCLFHFAFCTSTKINLFSVSRSCFRWTSPIPSINISPSKSHIHFPVRRSLQMISSIRSSCVISINILEFYREELAAFQLILFLITVPYSVRSQLPSTCECCHLNTEPEESSFIPGRNQVNTGFCYVLVQFSQTNTDTKLLIFIKSRISDTLYTQ